HGEVRSVAVHHRLETAAVGPGDRHQRGTRGVREHFPSFHLGGTVPAGVNRAATRLVGADGQSGFLRGAAGPGGHARDTTDRVRGTDCRARTRPTPALANTAFAGVTRR